MNKESITWGSRLIVYSYLKTEELLRKVTKLSNRERGFLLNSHIAGNRLISFKLEGSAKLQEIGMLNKKSVELNMSLFSDITLEINLDYYECHLALPNLCKFTGHLPLKFNDKRLSLKLNVNKPMKKNTWVFLKTNWRKNLIFKRIEYNFNILNNVVPQMTASALFKLFRITESGRLYHCRIM